MYVPWTRPPPKFFSLQTLTVGAAGWPGVVWQRITLENLIKRNRAAELAHTQPMPASCLQLPFILVRTDTTTFIDCVITPNQCGVRSALRCSPAPP
jgi:hypothetical protein